MGIILGLYWDYTGIMEKKMETTIWVSSSTRNAAPASACEGCTVYDSR